MQRTIASAAAALGLLLAGCQGPMSIEQVAVAPSAATFGEELAPVALDRVQFALRRGQVVGTYVNYGKLWVGCYSNVSDVVWAGTRETIEDQELEDIFFDELTAAGYNPVGNPDDLFADTSDVRAEPDFLVGGRVDALQMNVCNEWDGWRHTGAISGDAKMTVTWQIFSLLEGRVVYQTTTEGYANHEDGTLEGDYFLIADAFAAAAGNLAADARFHQLLATEAAPAQTGAADAALPTISLPVARSFIGGVENNVEPIDRAVITILLGNGHGSGFFISPALLLTNHHVAGNRDRVRILLSDGREVIGRVIRTDARRDVALIEIEAALANGLPLRTGLPARAETVYAVGSPDNTGLAGTITRGIVSQVRTDERDIGWIPADVTVHAGSSGGPLLDEAGNVVGITAWARVDTGGETKGLNFFVPIGDALRTLGIRIAGAGS
jgi:serine protease Do